MPTKTHTFNQRQHMVKRTFEIYHYRDSYINKVALHHHDFYEVYFFLSGNVEYGIESRSYHLTAGDILLISPNELHQPVFGRERQPYERIVLWIDKTYLQQYANIGLDVTQCFDNTQPGHSNLLRPDNAGRQEFVELLERMLMENDSGKYGSGLFAECCLVQILIMLNRLARHSAVYPELQDKSGTLVAGILDYINEHYAEDLTLDFLANRFFTSKYHLSREFGRLVGTSVHRYIIQKRLVMAKQMLGEGVPSSEAYQHCGFGDYSNFYRAFKAEYQISPKEYVSQLKETAAQNAEMTQERAWLLRDKP